MSVLVLDEKYRVLLDKKLREKIGLKKGDVLLAIPYSGGVLLARIKGKSFVGSLNDFKYDEKLHEASKYLFGKE
jgi:bifunctional DNA-binding transcriptional regulator/antitoxin component of YhaV-PrlF toxin-antitoxin module